MIIYGYLRDLLEFFRDDLLFLLRRVLCRLDRFPPLTTGLKNGSLSGPHGLT